MKKTKIILGGYLIMKTKQFQVENLVFRAFGQMGDDLGDLLYNEEAINSCLCKNTDVEIYNNFLTEELDSILAESYKQLLIKIKLTLNGCKNIYEEGAPRESVYIL